jgi:heme/copper-type cytochrome/quinol oxidase subunit 2
MVSSVYLLLYIVGAFTTMAVAHKLRDTDNHDDVALIGLVWPVLILIVVPFGIVYLLSYLSQLIKKIVK